ncbi:2-alkenal reductase [Pseudoscardovia radai]|uniref:2-alkenal reductase n=1 Tax=Pseudoscardovia radai TaxID=987066 RepID=A0A261ERA5_9BIFI|nr:Hsp70 family protein [Pseudoscardovia radai]OZG49390.1 2-alkenal reductase [Pseudoscardovia radai]
MSKYVYGIDLGTTYSCIAYQGEDGLPYVIKNVDTNSDTTPSVVQWDDDGTVVVGQQAKDSAVMSPERTIAFVKQLMGKTDIAIQIDGRDISPVEVSSYILKELARYASQQLDDEVKNVIITCPAYFGEAERTATKQAGEIAGLNVLAVIEEPTAAAICYGVTRSDSNQNVMVYDLGGGTFDITIMNINNGTIRVITTEGDHDLGGKKWDAVMSQLLVDKFIEASGYPGNPLEDDDNEEFLQDLAIKAEKAKQALTNRQEAKQVLNFNGSRAQVKVTREEFDEATSYLAESALELADKAVATAKEQGISIDQILLVGGSTKMPQIQNGVREHFGIEPKIFDPDEAVAKGAAIYAMLQADEQSKLREGEVRQTDEQGNDYAVDQETGEKRALPMLGGGGSALPMLGGGTAPIKVVSVSTKSFGVRAVDPADGKKYIYNVIMKDDELPANSTRGFMTLEDDQDYVELAVYQTPDKVDKYAVDEDRFLGNAELTLNPHTPKDSEISVTLELTEDGTVSLHAKDETSGRTVDAQWHAENVLSQKEVEETKKRVASTALASE